MLDRPPSVQPAVELERIHLPAWHLVCHVSELRETAAQAVKVDLALRAVAEAEAIECSDEDLEAEFAQVAEEIKLLKRMARRS